jgi:hypothetical protein
MLGTCYMLVSSLAYSSTLKTSACCSFETSVHFHLNTYASIPQDMTLDTTLLR